MVASRTVLMCALIGSLSFNVGCSFNIFHELQPHRIQRLNRGAAPSSDPEFSEFKRKRRTQLVKTDAPQKAPKLSANSAEIAVVRAQSPVAEPQ